jgi:hypothetical protein
MPAFSRRTRGQAVDQDSAPSAPSSASAVSGEHSAQIRHEFRKLSLSCKGSPRQSTSSRARPGFAAVRAAATGRPES